MSVAAKLDRPDDVVSARVRRRELSRTDQLFVCGGLPVQYSEMPHCCGVTSPPPSTPRLHFFSGTTTLQLVLPADCRLHWHGVPWYLQVVHGGADRVHRAFPASGASLQVEDAVRVGVPPDAAQGRDVPGDVAQRVQQTEPQRRPGNHTASRVQRQTGHYGNRGSGSQNSTQNLKEPSRLSWTRFNFCFQPRDPFLLLQDIFGALTAMAVSSGYCIGSANWVIQSDYEKVTSLVFVKLSISL